MPDDRAREQMQALVEVLEDIRRVAWDPQISDPFARAHIQSEVNRILSAHLAWISVSDSWCGERAREALAGAADEPEGSGERSLGETLKDFDMPPPSAQGYA